MTWSIPWSDSYVVLWDRKSTSRTHTYLNVTQNRDQDARRRGTTVYAEGRILKRGMETIFDCEPSGLGKNLPPHMKAPLPIALERSKGLLSDLQNRGAIVFCDRFFDANGNQVQDVQVTPDQFPATVFMVDAMNTSAALSNLLRQGGIPRLLNLELKNRKPTQTFDDGRSTVDSSSSVRIEPRPTRDPLTPAYDPNAYAPNPGSSREEKRKEESNDTPSPSLVLGQGLFPMLNGDGLHPFDPQHHLWDDLWLEQDQGAALPEFTLRLLRNEFSEIGKVAVKEVCDFFMILKKNTRLFQQHVDWKSPSLRIRSVMDQANRTTAAVVSFTQIRKGTSSSGDPRR
jgi:hypothetical protein